MHYPRLKQALLREALNVFYEVREVPGLKKKPSTSELIDWIKLLHGRGHLARGPAQPRSGKLIPPLHGALLKNEQDVHLLRAPRLPARAERAQLNVGRACSPSSSSS